MSLQQGAQTEAHATFTIGVAHVLENTAISDMYATDVVDRTQGLTALPTPCSNQSGKGEGIEIVNMEAQSQVPLIESEKNTCPFPTPINVRRLEETLTNHPNQEFVSKLCNNLRYGADVGFTGRRVARFSRNLPTALSQPNIVSENLSREVALGRVAGPFPSPPLPNFQVSPIGLVPKKHSTKFRTIFHLSFPKSGETSINSSISKEDFSLQYITIDNAIQGILSLGQGCFLAKTDVESAFRLIPLRPSDYELFGMYWEGNYYYDKVLPFGLRSAPFLFNLLSDAIEWILLNQCLVSFVCHILDDFLIIEPASSSPPLNLLCQQSLTSMLLTFRNLGIPIAANETEGPSTTLEFMGIILDTLRMEARLPADKVEQIQASLALFQTKRTCTLKELQSLIGTLNFACKVIPPGRPFLQRMIELTRKVSKPHHHIKLSKGFFKDLTMWQQFIHTWNGAGFFLPTSWLDSDSFELHTDASGKLGYGGILGQKWFQGRWETHHQLNAPGISIAWQELFVW